MEEIVQIYGISKWRYQNRVRTAVINLGHLLYSAIEIRQHLVAVLQTVGFQKKGRRFPSPSGPTKRRPSLCEFF